MALLRQGKAQALTIYLGESDQWQGTSLYIAMTHYLREQGCAGATVTRAITGYGGGVRLREQGGLHLSSDAPIVIQVIDQPERLQRVLPHLQEMLNGGLITLNEVEVLKYTHARLRGFPAKLQVRQVMATAVTTVDETTPVASVIALLLTAPFRTLPVVDRQQKLLGLIGTADLIQANALPVRRGMIRAMQQVDAQAIVEPLPHNDLRATDVMNTQLRTIGPEQTIREAARLMLESGVRRLPVVSQQGILLGMLTRSDLLQVIMTSPVMSAQSSSATQPLQQAGPHIDAQAQPVTVYMRTDHTPVREDMPLSEIIDALLISPWKRVVVIDEQQHVSGIISDVDVLQRLQAEVRPGLMAFLTNWARGKPGRLPTGALRGPTGQPRLAKDVMNLDVVTISEMATVQETIELMMTTGKKVLPVVDRENHLLGVVGRSDLLQTLVEGEEAR